VIEPQGQRSIDRVVSILSPRVSCVALTGAGLSTRSGIPDFRSPGTGIWEKVERADKEQNKIMTIQGFKEEPAAFYTGFHKFLEVILSAEPNEAHFALAELENGEYIQGVVTQNGDMLHQKAGSQNVVEIHGTLARATCISCYQSCDGLSLWKRFLSDGTMPKCRCGGIIKPDVILTGEQLPKQKILKAKRMIEGCDVILIAGTSLSGGPILNYVESSYEKGKKLIIVNLSPTVLDSVADVVVRADVVDALPMIMESLRVS